GMDLRVWVGSAAIAESRLARHRFGRRVYVDAVGETATCDLGRNAHGKRAKSRSRLRYQECPDAQYGKNRPDIHLPLLFYCPSVKSYTYMLHHVLRLFPLPYRVQCL